MRTFIKNLSKWRRRSSPNVQYLNLLSNYDASTAGKGLDSGERDTVMHYPMAYAVYASAEAIRAAQPGHPDALGNSLTAGMWLARNSDLDEDGEVGWGLPFAWDAFSDGTVNPAHTEYAITTAIVMHALADVIAALDARGHGFREERDKMVEALVAAGRAFVEKRRYEETESGISFWYSHLPCDAYHVLNITSMFSAALECAAKYADEERAKSFRSLAARGIEYVNARANRINEIVRWNYYGDAAPKGLSDKPNDLVHASYVVAGLQLYGEASGRPQHLAEPGAAGLVTFYGAKDVCEFPPEARRCRPARLWGAGYALYTLCLVPDFSTETPNSCKALNVYKAKQGRLGFRPDERIIYVRQETHALLGLAAYEYGMNRD